MTTVTSYMVAGTVEMVQKFKFKLLPYTTFRPDQGPFEYQVFVLRKNVICGCQFAKTKECKDVMCDVALHTTKIILC